jgi:pimeloyl-ACP methyl ester carboxylesterase
MSLALRLRLLLSSGIGLLLIGSPLAAQSVQQQRLGPSDPTHLYRTRKVSHELALYLLPTQSPTPRGVLLLLPGFGGPAKKVFEETSLGQEAARAGLVTVVPTLNNRLYLDSASTGFLDQVLRQIAQQYPTASRNLFIGGFSAGGHLALAYAEDLLRDTTRLPVRVKAVFGVDPPVDMAAFWQMGQRRIAQACSPLLVREGRSMVATLTQAFGGSPDQVPGAYRQYSAFSSLDPTGGNLSLLKATPVRVYCEPDLTFWRQQYCPTWQLEDLNAAMLKTMIACLRGQGNTRAEYIETTGKGRLGKRPFPHSWSIVDAPECVRWLQAYAEQ